MGSFVSTCVPYDATGRIVNLNTEYMFRSDGLKMKVLCFEYYGDDLWIALVKEKPLKADSCKNGERYDVSLLYVECPTNANTQIAIQDLRKLDTKMQNLAYALTKQRNTYDILVNYAFENLDIEKGTFIGATVNRVLIEILMCFRRDLCNIIGKLENSDAE